jgi:hypothetical protein
MVDDDLNAVGGHCPRCGTDYRPGFTECADCKVPLVPGPAPPPPPAHASHPQGRPAPLGDLAILGSWSWQEAWLVAGRLRAEGVDARVEPDDYTSSVPPPLVRQFFDVVVPRDKLPEASRITARYQTP